MSRRPGTVRAGIALALGVMIGGPLQASPSPSPSPSPSAVGEWHGVLDLGAARLTLVVQVDEGAEGALEGSLESVDQAPGELFPLSKIAAQDGTLSFVVETIGGRFDGAWSEEDGVWTGEWRQSGRSWPLALSADEPARRRPQTPAPPYPYRAEEVAFMNPAAEGVRLAGTLTLPDGAGPHPAAILLSGSGPQDRDETLFGHKPFAVLADHLTRRGIAVLRFDDRGTGASSGDFAAATTRDFAADARAAIAYLAPRPEIDGARIGLIGHSEGALTGAVAAGGNDGVAFLVMLAGPGIPFAELLLAQQRAIALGAGQSEEAIDEAEAVMRPLYEAAAAAPSKDAAALAVGALMTPEAMATLGVEPKEKPAIVVQFTSDWMRGLLSMDPAAPISRLSVPVLAVNGALDWQVAPAPNLAAIEAALSENDDATVVELEGLNHLFQTAETGAVAEYGQIEETMAPEVLELVERWISERVGAD